MTGEPPPRCAKGRRHTPTTQTCGRQKSASTHADFHGCARRRQRQSESRYLTRSGPCAARRAAAAGADAEEPRGFAAHLPCCLPSRPAEARTHISACRRRAARCVLSLHARRDSFARRIAHSARASGPAHSALATDSGMCASPATGAPLGMTAFVIPAVLAACGHCLACTAPLQLGAWPVRAMPVPARELTLLVPLHALRRCAAAWQLRRQQARRNAGRALRRRCGIAGPRRSSGAAAAGLCFQRHHGAECAAHCCLRSSCRRNGPMPVRPR